MKILLSIPPYITLICNYFNITFRISITSALLIPVTPFNILSTTIYCTTRLLNPGLTTTIATTTSYTTYLY
jgi:hypothetical protein